MHAMATRKKIREMRETKCNHNPLSIAVIQIGNIQRIIIYSSQRSIHTHTYANELTSRWHSTATCDGVQRWLVTAFNGGLRRHYGQRGLRHGSRDVGC